MLYRSQVPPLSTREPARLHPAYLTTPTKAVLRSDEISVSVSSPNQYQVHGNDKEIHTVGDRIRKDIQVLRTCTRQNHKIKLYKRTLLWDHFFQTGYHTRTLYF